MSQAWSVYVELDSRDVSDDAMDGLHENLAEASPSVGTAPNGNLSVRIFVDTATARQAGETALKTVTAAARTQGITAPVVGFEVLTEDELDRRNDEPAVPDLVGTAEIAEMLGVSRQRASQLIQRDDFPPAVATLKATPVFLRDQVEAFGRRWDGKGSKGGRPPKPVELTGVERDLLAALSIARNAAVHGEAGSGQRRWQRALGAHVADVHRLVPSERGDDALEVSVAPQLVQALQNLARHSLVNVLDVRTDPDGDQSAAVELTPKGERTAATA